MFLCDKPRESGVVTSDGDIHQLVATSTLKPGALQYLASDALREANESNNERYFEGHENLFPAVSEDFQQLLAWWRKRLSFTTMPWLAAFKA